MAQWYRHCFLITSPGFDSRLGHRIFLQWRIIPRYVRKGCLRVLCPYSVLCCLRSRFLHSANHRPGEAFQQCNIPICVQQKLQNPDIAISRWRGVEENELNKTYDHETLDLLRKARQGFSGILVYIMCHLNDSVIIKHVIRFFPHSMQ